MGHHNGYFFFYRPAIKRWILEESRTGKVVCSLTLFGGLKIIKEILGEKGLSEGWNVELTNKIINYLTTFTREELGVLEVMDRLNYDDEEI